PPQEGSESKTPAGARPPAKGAANKPAEAKPDAARLDEDNGDGLAQVSGTVSYKGLPLPAGTIAFVSGLPIAEPQTATVKDGVYTVKAGVRSGDYAGAVTPSSPPGGPALVIPLKYRSATTSGLRVRLKKGDNTFNVNLD